MRFFKTIYACTKRVPYWPEREREIGGGGERERERETNTHTYTPHGNVREIHSRSLVCQIKFTTFLYPKKQHKRKNHHGNVGGIGRLKS
jgi:hypothetical protein